MGGSVKLTGKKIRRKDKSYFIAELNYPFTLVLLLKLKFLFLLLVIVHNGYGMNCDIDRAIVILCLAGQNCIIVFAVI